MRKVFILLLWSLPLLAFGQKELSVKGAVQEQGSGATLPGATVRLLQNDVLKIAVSTDEQGNFSLGGLKSGKYMMITRFVGYTPDTLVLSLKKDTTLVLQLRNENSQLTEVVIKTDIPPASVRLDTISYNAQAYPSRPNATVEELLRKLPGIEIDQDGNITLQGQKVDKILIDGKTFFIDDLRKATQNLPADIVSQVETFDSQSDADKAAGIIESGAATKTINLKLKKKFKESEVGKLYAVTGNNGAYSAGGNITGLGATLFSADVSSNNINNQFTGSENNYATGAAGQVENTNIQLNYKKELSNTLTLNVFAGRNFNSSSQQSSTDKQTFLTDSSLLQKDQSANAARNSNYNAGADLEYKPDAKTYVSDNINYGPSSGKQCNTDTTVLQTLKNGQLYPTSNGYTNNLNQQQTYALNNNLEYTHRFNKTRRAIKISFGASLNNQQQHQDIYSQTTTATVNQQVINPVNTNNLNTDISYIEPVTKGLNMRVNYSSSISDNHTGKDAEDYDPATRSYDLPDSASSDHFDDKVYTNAFRLHVSNLHDDKLYLDLSLGAQSSKQANLNQTSGTAISRGFNSLLPEAMFRYALNKAENVTIHYAGNSLDPTIDQLAPVPDLSNPYLIKVGNPGLRQAFVQDVNISFINFNGETAHNLQVRLDVNDTQHPISSATTTLPAGVQEVEFVNLDNDYNLNAFATYGLPFISQSHGTASIGPGIMAGHNESLVNGQLNSDQTSGLSGNLHLHYHAGDKFFIESNAVIAYIANHYSADNQTDSRTLQQDYNADAYVTLPLATIAGGHYDYQVRSTSGLPGQQNNFVNAYVGKDLDSKHAAQIRLSGFNLLNTAASLTQSTGPNYIQTQQSNTQHRLLLLSFVYNFKRFNTGG
jgi:hypothetical protein